MTLLAILLLKKEPREFLSVSWQILLKNFISKTSVESLRDLTWTILSSLFAREKKKKAPLPPVYFFLSPWSDGSLKNRDSSEKQLVHRQQEFGQGVSLIDPPAAW